jgi:hypothetical protein
MAAATGAVLAVLLLLVCPPAAAARGAVQKNKVDIDYYDGENSRCAFSRACTKHVFSR